MVYDPTAATYRIKPARCLADCVFKQLLSDEGQRLPLIIERFKKGSYVDDITGGNDTISRLNEIVSQVEALCLTGCFSVAKWKANHPSFCKLNSSHLSSNTSHQFLQMFSRHLDFHRPHISKLGHNKLHHTLGNRAAVWFSWINLIIARVKILISGLMVPHYWKTSQIWLLKFISSKQTPEFKPLPTHQALFDVIRSKLANQTVPSMTFSTWRLSWRSGNSIELRRHIWTGSGKQQ